MSEPCRRCGGTEQYAREVHAMDGTAFNLLPIGVLKAAKLDLRVCGACGLMEFSVPDRYLPAVREHFTRVP